MTTIKLKNQKALKKFCKKLLYIDNSELSMWSRTNIDFTFTSVDIEYTMLSKEDIEKLLTDNKVPYLWVSQF